MMSTVGREYYYFSVLHFNLFRVTRFLLHLGRVCVRVCDVKRERLRERDDPHALTNARAHEPTHKHNTHAKVIVKYAKYISAA